MTFDILHLAFNIFFVLLILRAHLREAAKKSSSTNGPAIKRGGGKGRAIKEKRTFWNFFFLPFKN